MGFNSVLFICNDAISSIEADPKGWWDAAWEALSRCMRVPKTFGFRGSANGFRAVTNHHADVHSIIFAGGNYVTVLHQSHRGNKGHHTVEEAVELLKEAVDKLGYKLIRNGKGARVCQTCAHYGKSTRCCLRVPARYTDQQPLDTCHHWLENKTLQES